RKWPSRLDRGGGPGAGHLGSHDGYCGITPDRPRPGQQRRRPRPLGGHPIGQAERAAAGDSPGPDRTASSTNHRMRSPGTTVLSLGHDDGRSRARPGGGTGRRQVVRTGALARLGMRLAHLGMDRASPDASVSTIPWIQIDLESAIIERAETHVRHPVFAPAKIDQLAPSPEDLRETTRAVLVPPVGRGSGHRASDRRSWNRRPAIAEEWLVMPFRRATDRGGR
ncbi:MAG: hypothetical protein JWP02_2742, partial [Acidimicrobiales bacterium]|nr:hypothetical protein [Acidimicrobiales bacterium]